MVFSAKVKLPSLTHISLSGVSWNTGVYRGVQPWKTPSTLILWLIVLLNWRPGNFFLSSFPSRVDALREGDRGILAYVAIGACGQFAKPNEVGLVGAGSSEYTWSSGYLVITFIRSWCRGIKGGSRVLGKGGEQKKVEVTVHVMVPSTGRRPVDATPWASLGGGLEEGVPPPESEKNWNKEDFRRNLVTHGSQIYWIELQFCCLLNSQVGIIQVSMFLSTSRSYQFTSFTLPISTCTRCQVYT